MYTRITGDNPPDAEKGIEWAGDYPILFNNRGAKLSKLLKDLESQPTADIIRNGLSLPELDIGEVRKLMKERASRQPGEEEE